MKTPKEYTDSLKKHVITEKMLEDCLYSVNKRAKNYRDRVRETRYQYGRNAIISDSVLEGKDHNYRIKEMLLCLLTPSCIHREFAGFDRERIYDYDKRYDEYERKNAFIWENCYYDHDLDREVWFGDIENKTLPHYRYYLFYELGGHSFHTPIGIEQVESSDLTVTDIDTLETYGDDIENLVSTQFIKKVVNMLLSGQYTLDFTTHVNVNPDFSSYADLQTEETKARTRVSTDHITINDKHITTVLQGDIEMPVKEYIEYLANKKGTGINKGDALEYAEKHGMKVTKKTLMRDAIRYIIDKDLHFDIAKKFHLGVTKYDYRSAGMSEKEYRKLTSQKKLKVVGQYLSETRYYGKQPRNLYDIQQYLEWRSTGVA